MHIHFSDIIALWLSAQFWTRNWFCILE